MLALLERTPLPSEGQGLGFSPLLSDVHIRVARHLRCVTAAEHMVQGAAEGIHHRLAPAIFPAIQVAHFGAGVRVAVGQRVLATHFAAQDVEVGCGPTGATGVCRACRKEQKKAPDG